MQAASALLEEAVDWLREHYEQFEFWVERDLVWTVQTRLRRLVSDRSLRTRCSTTTHCYPDPGGPAAPT